MLYLTYTQKQKFFFIISKATMRNFGIPVKSIYKYIPFRQGNVLVGITVFMYYVIWSYMPTGTIYEMAICVNKIKELFQFSPYHNKSTIG